MSFVTSTVGLIFFTRKSSIFFKASFMIMMSVSCFVVLLSPRIVGIYAMSGGDYLSHIGMVRDIIASGSIIPSINYYPFTHLLAFSIFSIVGILPSDALWIISPILTILFPYVIYAIAKKIWRDEHISIIAFLLGSSFFLSGLFEINAVTIPLGVSILFLPLILFGILILKDNKLQLMVCVLILLFASVFIHPLTSIILCATFIFLSIYQRKHIDIKKYSSPMLLYVVAAASYILLATTIWINPRDGLELFLSGQNIGYNYGVDVTGSLSTLSLTPLDIMGLLLRLFTHQLILLSLSLLYILKISFRRKGDITAHTINTEEFVVLGFMLVGGALLIAQLVAPTLMNISFYRFLIFLLVFSPLFSSVMISRGFPSARRRIGAFSVVTIVILASLLVVYSSPYVNQPNQQVSTAEFTGAKWLVDEKDHDVKVSGYFGVDVTIRIASSVMPYSDFLNDKYGGWVDENTKLSNHLGVDEQNNTYNINGSRYIIITSMDRITYSTIYSSLDRLNSTDMHNALMADEFDIVYSNPDYSILYKDK